ncbi:rRNA adenine N-6-methyltransferase family protein [Candidatus Palauibacter sp.]|uniref:rRNA adenine N-6-methyltransferase family protein n=1 Tax=Candidatus Palauibacter sp. TaxID=3101350 RepID=UPI003B017E7F
MSPTRSWGTFRSIGLPPSSGGLSEADSPPQDAWLVIQREAAERFAGSPCSRETLPSLLLKPWWQIEIVRRFRRTDFDPPPSVDAVALWLARRTRPLVDRFQAVDYRRFIQSCFGRDGRSIRRCLRSEFTRTQISPAESRSQVRSFRTTLRPHLRPVARIVQVPEADAIVSADGASAH